MKKLKQAAQVAVHLGPRWCAFRVAYALKRRSGWYERGSPAIPWSGIALATFLPSELATTESYRAFRRKSAASFFFDSRQRLEWQPLLAAFDQDHPDDILSEARLITQGRFRFYSGFSKEIGFPPDWHRNAITGERAPEDVHWSRMPDFAFGDIKNIWEPSRFGFAFPLVRAYWRDGNPEWAETFWTLFEDWTEKNPPELGVNWKCGQELSLKLMACAFAFYGFEDAEATTADRVGLLAKFVYLAANRVEANLGYALSQKSNHGHSEALGLFLAGTLFPEMKGADRWQTKGKNLLEKLAEELNYKDGNSCMHSLNYQRMMIEVLLWGVRLGELNGHPLKEVVKERVKAAAEFFYQCQNGEDGRVPNYGSNDGAAVFPVTDCHYRDYRPVVQMAAAMTDGHLRYERGCFDEAVLWLLGPEGLQMPRQDVARQDFAAEPSGFYTLRSRESFAFFRCGKHRHRPSHADMLHTDIWWKGQNVALDPGTFSYNGVAPFDHGFKATRFHNTVEVDGVDQMESVSRFLWMPWVQGRLLAKGRSGDGKIGYLIGEHDGYRRLKPAVTHKRGLIQVGDETFLVIDFLQSPEAHDYRLHWALTDFPIDYDQGGKSATLQTEKGPYFIAWGNSGGGGQDSLVRACETSSRGWSAEHYQERRPAISLESRVRGKSVVFWTLFSPERATGGIDGPEGEWASGQLRMNVRVAQGRELPLESVQLIGSEQTQLTF